MKKFKRIISLIIVVIVVLSISASDKVLAGYKPYHPKIMKGVWVSYIDLSLNYDKSFSAFKNKFDKIAENSKKNGFNTIIVQVRPFNDALYKSKYFPISHILTGKQGGKISYDPLKYMVQKAHKEKLSIQAWVNPYRVRLNGQPKYLSKDNPYIRNKKLGVKWKGDIYLKPSSKKAANIIVKGIKEIVQNYNVDGVQLDDYFYPTTSQKFDRAEYTKYKNSSKQSKSLSKWRMSNVNNMVKRIYNSIKEINSKVDFGISPQGHFDNNKYLYADVKTWCEKSGYIDYICPQIYWGTESKGALTFDKAIAPWLKLKFAKNIKLYIGLAAYKAGTCEDCGGWKGKNNILAKEFKSSIKKYRASGVMVFRYEHTISPLRKKEINNLKKEFKKYT